MSPKTCKECGEEFDDEGFEFDTCLECEAQLEAEEEDSE